MTLSDAPVTNRRKLSDAVQKADAEAVAQTSAGTKASGKAAKPTPPPLIVDDPSDAPWGKAADVGARAKPLNGVKGGITRSEATLKLMGLLTVVLIALNAGILHLALNPPENPYRVTAPAKINEEGASQVQVGQVRAMDSQLLTGPQAEQFAVRAITRAFNFNFGNYLDVQNGMKEYFTDQAWDLYRENLGEGFLEAVVTNKQILTTMIDEDPVIVSEGEFEGRYTWNIEMMILINVQSGDRPVSQRYLAQVGIVEIPLSSPDAITADGTVRSMAINRLVFRSAGSR